MSESNVPADLEACPRCEATVRADVPLARPTAERDLVQTCPECGARLRPEPLGGWILAERGDE